jgi:hypothetical protein
LTGGIMEKKFAKGSSEWMMFMDYWALCQKYWDPDDNDDYWESVVKETDVFYRKYNSEFAKSLALTLVNELERKSISRK